MITRADCAGLEVLGELEPALLARVAAQCRIVTFPAGNHPAAGSAERPGAFCALRPVCMCISTPSSRSQPIEIEAGRMFGEMSVIDGLPVSAFVIAAEPCRILLLPAEVFWSEVVPAPASPARSCARSAAASGPIRTALLRAMQDRIQHAALEHEFRLAREIQMGMLRRVKSVVPGSPRFRDLRQDRAGEGGGRRLLRRVPARSRTTSCWRSATPRARASARPCSWCAR